MREGGCERGSEGLCGRQRGKERGRERGEERDALGRKVEVDVLDDDRQQAHVLFLCEAAADARTLARQKRHPREGVLLVGLCGVGFQVPSFGFRVQEKGCFWSGCALQSLGFRVKGLGLRV